MNVSYCLTSGIRKASLSFSAVWAGVGESLVFVQAGLAVDPPTAWHLVGGAGHKKADLTHQFVWWCVHKRAVIPTSQGNIGSHLHYLHKVVNVHQFFCPCMT